MYSRRTNNNNIIRTRRPRVIFIRVVGTSPWPFSVPKIVKFRRGIINIAQTPVTNELKLTRPSVQTLTCVYERYMNNFVCS